MLKISTKGVFELQKKYSGLSQQMPYAIAKALTKTAQAGQVGVIEEMRKTFDKPTPWTLRSCYIVPAQKNKLIASVKLKDEWSTGSFGTPATKYLSPQIFGGERNLKRHEKGLQYSGTLPSGLYAVPGQGADLDSYGNMKASQIIQIMSYFRAFAEQGFKANITAARKAKLKRGTKKQRGYQYFAIGDRRRTHLRPGIYKRVAFGSWGGAIKPIVMFVRKPSYKPRFEFYKTAEVIAKNMFVHELNQAVKGIISNGK